METPCSGKLGDNVVYFLSKPYWLRTQELPGGGVLSVSLVGAAPLGSLSVCHLSKETLNRHFC